MLRTFIDDSGSGGDSPWFVLAGYIGTVEAWDAFDKPWRALLDGPPKLEYFKASEAESLRSDGQWAGISKDDRNKRIDALIEVIGKHALRSMYVRVRQKDYDEVIKPYVPPQWDNAYYSLFIAMIAGVASIEHYVSRRPVEFFFDHANRLEKPSKRLYGQVSELPQFGNRVVNIHYEDEQEFLPLQAADLLAWQIRRRFCAENEPPRPQFETAIKCPSGPPFNHTIERSDLEKHGQLMDDNAMLNWALMGYPESTRKWRRPR